MGNGRVARPPILLARWEIMPFQTWPNQCTSFKALVSCVLIVFVLETNIGVNPMPYSSCGRCVIRLGWSWVICKQLMRLTRHLSIIMWPKPME